MGVLTVPCFQTGPWMVVNFQLEKLSILTHLSGRMFGGPQNRSGQCGEKEI
jgi:hypothetical protein